MSAVQNWKKIVRNRAQRKKLVFFSVNFFKQLFFQKSDFKIKIRFYFFSSIECAHIWYHSQCIKDQSIAKLRHNNNKRGGCVGGEKTKQNLTLNTLESEWFNVREVIKLSFFPIYVSIFIQGHFDIFVESQKNLILFNFRMRERERKRNIREVEFS